MQVFEQHGGLVLGQAGEVGDGGGGDVRAGVERGELHRRREARAAAEVEAIALGTLRARIGSVRDGTALPALAARVADGSLDPYTAAAELLDHLDA